MQLAQIKYRQELQERHEKCLNSIRKGWSQIQREFQTSKSEVETKYDNLLTRLEFLTESLRSQFVKLRDKNKKLRIKVDGLKMSAKRAHQAFDSTIVDSSGEIEVETSLKMQRDRLLDQLDMIKCKISNIHANAEKYQALYIQTTGKQHKLRQKELDQDKIRKMELDRKECLVQFREKISEEMSKLNKDIESLKNLRNQLTNPAKTPEPTPVNPMEKYRQLLISAGQLSPSQEISIHNDELDDEQPINENQEKIDTLNRNISILLSTGNYSEKDSIIVSLRNQLKSLQQ